MSYHYAKPHKNTGDISSDPLNITVFNQGNQSTDRGNPTEALNNLDDADFVGLTDFYHESICMLHFRREKELRPGCNCKEDSTSNHEHVTHGVPEKKNKPTAQMVEIIDSLTVLDAILFQKALTRFFRDLSKVEKEAGASVLCDRTKLGGVGAPPP